MIFDLHPYYHEYKTNKNLDHQDDNEEIYYFAYGSNMNDRQMDLRRVSGMNHLRSLNVWPREWEDPPKPAVVVGRALLKGYRFTFDKQSGVPQFCYASVCSDPNSIVEGVLYKLDKKFIKVLDFYEGVQIDQYTRELVEVFVDSETSFRALIYMAHSSSITLDGIPCKSYLQTIVEGAEKFGLSDKYLARLKEWPTADYTAPTHPE